MVSARHIAVPGTGWSRYAVPARRYALEGGYLRLELGGQLAQLRILGLWAGGFVR
jgi:hypothetical protein